MCRHKKQGETTALTLLEALTGITQCRLQSDNVPYFNNCYTSAGLSSISLRTVTCTCHLISCQEGTNLRAPSTLSGDLTEVLCFTTIGTHLCAPLFQVTHTVLTYLLPHSLRARRTNCLQWLLFRSSTAREELWLSRNTRNRHIKIHHFSLLTCYHWVWHTLSQKVAPGEN